MAEENKVEDPVDKPVDSCVSSSGTPLSRKRTRDDVNGEDLDEVKEREIKLLKRGEENAEARELESSAATAEADESNSAEVSATPEKLEQKEEKYLGHKKEVQDEKEEEKAQGEQGDREDRVELVTEEGTGDIAEGTEKKTETKLDVTERQDTPGAQIPKEPSDGPNAAGENAKESTGKTESTKSKFVFGATTPFGANAFSLLDKKANVFQSNESSPSPGSASVFGSKASFGNAFQSSISKKSIFEDSDGDSTSVDESKESSSANLYKQVNLEKKEIKSGEEDEEQVFTCRAKLYALDLTDVKSGWKERGAGNVHVNKSKTHSSRIIMRSNGLLKVILNTALVQGLEIIKGMPSSLHSEKFIRITSVEDGKPLQYAVKTGTVETTLSLYESLTALIPSV